MRNYTRTLILVATCLSLLLVAMLAGCQQADPEVVGGGSLDNATGRVGGCVETPVREAKK